MDEITETSLLNPQNPQNTYKYKADNSVNKIIGSFGIVCGTFIIFTFTFCIANIYTGFNAVESGFIGFGISFVFFYITFLLLRQKCFKQEDYDKILADDNSDDNSDSNDDNSDNHEYSNYNCKNSTNFTNLNKTPIENDNENKLIETSKDNSITIVYQDLEPMYKNMW